MEKQNCKISMTSAQTVDGARDETRFVYEGSFIKRQEALFVSYREEMEGSVSDVLLKIEEGMVTLTKKGDAHYRMEFASDNEVRDCVIASPAGRLVFGVKTRRLVVDMGSAKGQIRLEISYELLQGEAVLSENHLIIKVEM